MIKVPEAPTEDPEAIKTYIKELAKQCGLKVVIFNAYDQNYCAEISGNFGC